MTTHSDFLLGNAFFYIDKRRRFLKGRFITSLIVFAFFSGFVCSSQNLKFNKISVKDGLSHSVVKQVLQDKYHNLWFSTGNGVCKYDGKTFKTYLPDKNNPKYSIPDYLI